MLPVSYMQLHLRRTVSLNINCSSSFCYWIIFHLCTPGRQNDRKSSPDFTCNPAHVPGIFRNVRSYFISRFTPPRLNTFTKITVFIPGGFSLWKNRRRNRPYDWRNGPDNKVRPYGFLKSCVFNLISPLITTAFCFPNIWAFRPTVDAGAVLCSSDLVSFRFFIVTM